MSVQSWDCERPPACGSDRKLDHGFPRTILDVIPSGVAVVDQQGVIVYVNREWATVSHGGGEAFPGQERVGGCVLRAAEPTGEAKASHAEEAGRAIRGVLSGALEEYEMEYAGGDGVGKRRYRLSVRPVVHGSVYAVVAREDITGGRRGEQAAAESTQPAPERSSETALREALVEKESLLREVHHRVKNNLQIISSLLSLQMHSVPDQSVRSALLESRTRIRSMALVHEQLYRSGTFSGIEFGTYVRELAENVLRASIVTVGAVTAEVRMEDIRLQLDTTIPLGLIVNELLTNATKYAFPGGRKGTIVIGMETAGQGSYRLTIGDDGVGLPDGLDISTSGTLGLNLVNTLVAQLDGRIELGPGPGTVYTISFAEQANAIR